MEMNVKRCTRWQKMHTNSASEQIRTPQDWGLGKQHLFPYQLSVWWKPKNKGKWNDKSGKKLFQEESRKFHKKDLCYWTDKSGQAEEIHWSELGGCRLRQEEKISYRFLLLLQFLRYLLMDIVRLGEYFLWTSKTLFMFLWDTRGLH